MESENKNILLAIHEEMLAFILSKLLIKAGYHVTIAKDELETLYILNTFTTTAKPFNIILIDMKLAELTNWRLAKKLEKSGKSTFIIINTTLEKQIVLDKLPSNNNIKFIEKPFSKEDILELIDND